MPLEITEHAGFCMGVQRAVDAALRAAEEGGPLCTLGELTHNPQVVELLKAKGVPSVDDLADIGGRKVIVRSHGVTPKTLDLLYGQGVTFMDCTCPFVDRMHRIVKEYSAQGKPVVLVGQRDHPEVQGTAGWCQGPVYILREEEEIAALPPLDEALAVVQTTFPPDKWERMADLLKERIPGLTVKDTICPETRKRQEEARDLASRADAMIVVGGLSSANTRKLLETCQKLCKRTIQVERAADIPPGFADIHADLIGITAGASTPDWSLKEVVTRMIDRENQDQMLPAEEESKNNFMADVEATLVKIKPGQTVTGTVVQITDEEVCVNIGYKSDGLIKRSDVTSEDLELGQEIEVEVVKVNDGEGNVVLSQRNIVNRKAWDALMVKYEAGEYVEGVGKEAVKGGLIAEVDGIRTFVPASQLSQRYVEKISEFVGKPIKLKIIEVDKQKKRIVASRKAYLTEESASKKKEAWDKLTEGEVVTGIVRRLTDFGAFVDVGGVDGLIHVTDLSWGRIKHPSEVVTPNQEVQVKILSLDRERERIQLGYKQLAPKPWDVAEEKYAVGSVVEGKVVRITTFGAFVELEPGLDGLVHISQCALTRVQKVEDAVKVGQTVRVKVLKVEPAEKRISLSIREVLEDEAFNYSQEIPGEGEFEAGKAPAEQETAQEEAPAAEEAVEPKKASRKKAPAKEDATEQETEAPKAE
jgi:4-hydroxy-3-methylbut-2-enyl diphosphate reductase